MLPWLVGALDPLEKKGLCKLFAFSTVVDSIKRGRLLKDRMNNTYGTDINCVLQHILSLPVARRPRKAVVLTDGYTGTPAPSLMEEIRKQKIDLYVGLVGGTSDELRPYAKLIEQLPRPA